jgi:hypothetical protein
MRQPIKLIVNRQHAAAVPCMIMRLSCADDELARAAHVLYMLELLLKFGLGICPNPITDI